MAAGLPVDKPGPAMEAAVAELGPPAVSLFLQNGQPNPPGHLCGPRAMAVVPRSLGLGIACRFRVRMRYIPKDAFDVAEVAPVVARFVDAAATTATAATDTTKTQTASATTAGLLSLIASLLPQSTDEIAAKIAATASTSWLGASVVNHGTQSM